MYINSGQDQIRTRDGVERGLIGFLRNPLLVRGFEIQLVRLPISPHSQRYSVVAPQVQIHCLCHPSASLYTSSFHMLEGKFKVI